jgi:hypothetical protein
MIGEGIDDLRAYSFTAQVVDTKIGKPKTQNTATATLSITIS